VCDRCHVYADGKRAIELSVEERRVLIEFVPHSTPARAIPLSRLAYEVCGDENQVKETINSLRRKGIVIDQINGRYYLRPRAETNPVQNVQPAGGIELSLPLGDRT
jgi:biotin operon repressor